MLSHLTHRYGILVGTCTSLFVAGVLGSVALQSTGVLTGDTTSGQAPMTFNVSAAYTPTSVSQGGTLTITITVLSTSTDVYGDTLQLHMPGSPLYRFPNTTLQYQSLAAVGVIRGTCMSQYGYCSAQIPPQRPMGDGSIALGTATFRATYRVLSCPAVMGPIKVRAMRPIQYSRWTDDVMIEGPVIPCGNNNQQSSDQSIVRQAVIDLNQSTASSSSSSSAARSSVAAQPPGPSTVKPTITSLTPSSGTVRSTVTIEGTGFTSRMQVVFSSNIHAFIIPVFVDSTHVRFTVPSRINETGCWPPSTCRQQSVVQDTDYNVRVQLNGYRSNALQFRVTPTPNRPM